ncbi:MAG: hypothetical protein HZB24_07485 [Desulfobacterales bacterium]|nr:hypothetical protein [Desulfobacterales bacterium]
MDEDKLQSATFCCRPEEWFDRLPLVSQAFLAHHHRPIVTVSYAQSVDGSIATRNREPLQFSGSTRSKAGGPNSSPAAATGAAW